MSRLVSFEYLNRQLVWQELSDFLLFVLPLVNVSRIKRAMLRAFPRLPLLTAAAAGVGLQQGWTVAARKEEGGGGAAAGGDGAAGLAAAADLRQRHQHQPEPHHHHHQQQQQQQPEDEAEEAEQFEPPGPCPICGLREIVVPYAALPCRHVFCYYCLRAHCEADTAFECPVDGVRVAALQRFDGRREG